MVNFTAADRVGVVGGYLGGLNTLFGGNGLGGLFGGGKCRDGYDGGYDGSCSKYCHHVTEHELELVQCNNKLLAENSALISEKYTDNKTEMLANRVCELEKCLAVTATREADFQGYVNAEFIHQPKAKANENLVLTQPCQPCAPYAPYGMGYGMGYGGYGYGYRPFEGERREERRERHECGCDCDCD